MGFMLKQHGPTQERFNLYAPVRAAQYGVRPFTQALLGLIEMYYLWFYTFFMLGGEMGLALCEMLDISFLSMSDYPYEEYLPIEAELVKLWEEHAMAHPFTEV